MGAPASVQVEIFGVYPDDQAPREFFNFCTSYMRITTAPSPLTLCPVSAKYVHYWAVASASISVRSFV